MPQPARRHLHLDALDIRLNGHEPSVAAMLARDLPGALEQALGAGPPARPQGLAQTVAAEVAAQVRARLGPREG